MEEFFFCLSVFTLVSYDKTCVVVVFWLLWFSFWMTPGLDWILSLVLLLGIFHSFSEKFFFGKHCCSIVFLFFFLFFLLIENEPDDDEPSTHEDERDKGEPQNTRRVSNISSTIYILLYISIDYTFEREERETGTSSIDPSIIKRRWPVRVCTCLSSFIDKLWTQWSWWWV